MSILEGNLGANGDKAGAPPAGKPPAPVPPAPPAAPPADPPVVDMNELLEETFAYPKMAEELGVK